MRTVMESFRLMTNDAIRDGLELEKKNLGRSPSLKRLSNLCYGSLRKRYAGYSPYILCAISKAAGILAARNKSIKRGFSPKRPYVRKPVLVSCYGFKIENGELVVHLDSAIMESIPLNPHTKSLLSNPELRVRSFTLTLESLSICVSKDVGVMDGSQLSGTVGVDRNLRNLTVGNIKSVTQYDMTKLVRICESSRNIVRSFKRDDDRIRTKLAAKYGKRQKDRTRQFIHLISKKVVSGAKLNAKAIIFEEIKGIRKLYRKGNGQGASSRSRMNSWPFHEIKRQIEYKAAWEGVPVITLTRGETSGTTMDCPRCGERLQVPIRGDTGHYRQLWCDVCKRWRDRDLVAVLNISRRGWLRFDHSPKEGGAAEAMKRNPDVDAEPVILRVDASNLSLAREIQ